MRKVDVFTRTRNMYQLNVYLCYIDLLKTNILPIKLVNVKLIDRLSKNWQLIASKNYWLYISIVTKNKPKYIKCDESYRTIICNIRRHKSVVISSGRHFLWLFNYLEATVLCFLERIFFWKVLPGKMEILRVTYKIYYTATSAKQSSGIPCLRCSFL